jgi:hypothetical protein
MESFEKSIILEMLELTPIAKPLKSFINHPNKKMQEDFLQISLNFPETYWNMTMTRGVTETQTTSFQSTY